MVSRMPPPDKALRLNAGHRVLPPGLHSGQATEQGRTGLVGKRLTGNRGKSALRVIALATFGAGIGWLLSVQGSRTSVDMRPETIPEYGSGQTLTPSPA